VIAADTGALSGSLQVQLVGDFSDMPSSPRGSSRVVTVSAASPAASGTGDYENPNSTRFAEGGSRFPESASGSRDHVVEPLWRTYLRQRLLELMPKVNWPSYPVVETLNGAWSVAHGVLSPGTSTPSVVPGEDRSVELIWNRGDWHIELEVLEGSQYVWAKNLRTGEVVSGDLSDTRAALRDLLAEVSTA
jgi:hypothetical protein